MLVTNKSFLLLLIVSTVITYHSNAYAQSSPSGKGLAAKYNKDSGIQADPAVIFSDGFESYSSTNDIGNAYDGLWQRINVTVETGDRIAGSKSLKIRMPQAGYEISNAIAKKIPNNNEVFVRVYFKFAAGYSGVNSAHDGIAFRGSYSGPGNGFRGLLVAVENSAWWGEPNIGPTHAYVYHAEQNDRYGEHWFPDGHTTNGSGPDIYQGSKWGSNFIPRAQKQIPLLNKWICREVRVKTNTPGQRNGRVTIWDEGVVVADWGNINFNGDPVKEIQLENGGQGSNRLNNKWYDNLVIAKSYIGCMGDSTLSPPVKLSVPKNLKVQ